MIIQIPVGQIELINLLWSVVTIVVAGGLGLAGHYILFGILKDLSARTTSKVDDSLVKHWRSPSRWIIIILVLMIVVPLIDSLGARGLWVSKYILNIALIGSVAWLAISSTKVLDDFVLSQYKLDVKDNLQARKVHTQLRVFRRIVVLIVVILALGTMLMTFEQVRSLGTSILASAGIIGLVVGIAAQKTLGTVLAGIQIAITQPIRIDDVVIVENEWGRIEEITLTYVVVRIWDLRRLVLPITYFIEKPFQNWTRVTADILGTVYLYTDYTIPVEAVRSELERIVKDSPEWDGKACGLQVTNSTDRSLELRALVSAADASVAWNLRCKVREKLVEFIQKNYPEALPKTRAEIDQSPDQKTN